MYAIEKASFMKQLCYHRSYIWYSLYYKCELMKLSLPLVSSMYADAAFTVAAPKYWNSLPDELRTMSSFMSFKCRLHTYMVSL